MTDPTAAHVWGCTTIDCEGECRGVPSPRQDPEPAPVAGSFAARADTLYRAVRSGQWGKAEVAVYLSEYDAASLPSRAEVERAVDAYRAQIVRCTFAHGDVDFSGCEDMVSARAALLSLIFPGDDR